MITQYVPNLKINKLTQEQFDREFAAGNIDETALYLTPDEDKFIISETEPTGNVPDGTIWIKPLTE